MVSTHSQYLSDYNSPLLATVDVGKSPLAMLAKTCETIGLPDTPNRKANKEEKLKDSHSPSTSSTSCDSKKDELSPVHKKKEGSKSPRITAHSPNVGKKTPVTSEPSTSTAPLPTNMMLNPRGGYFPMAFPPLGSSFPVFPYPPMMPGFPTMPGFPGGFSATPAPSPFLRCPDPLTCKGCPASLIARSCATPGCVSCSMHSSVSSPAEMMTAFSSPFFSSYNPLMAAGAVTLPPTSSSSAQLAYQNLMAAASSQATKHVCNWMDATGVCGKSFSTTDELASHMKATHASSSAVSIPNTNSELKPNSPKASTTPLTSHPSLRYHPYMKPGGMLPSMAMTSPLGIPTPFGMPGFPSTVALQAMYAQQQQRLMANIPHP